MNHQEFKKHIAENGITLAKTTEEFEDIPKGTKLYFGIDNDFISSYEVDTKNRNKQFNYDFDYEWFGGWYSVYEGEFELINKKTMKELLIKSERFPELLVQIIDGKVSLLDDSYYHEDSDIYIYEVYKLLKKADERDGFEHLKGKDKIGDNDATETIFV